MDINYLGVDAHLFGDPTRDGAALVLESLALKRADLADFLYQIGARPQSLDGPIGEDLAKRTAAKVAEEVCGLGNVKRDIPPVMGGEDFSFIDVRTPQELELARIPQAGEVRGNLAAGGTGIAMPLSDRERQIGEALAPILLERGLLLVGLDVIGNYLTEINVTSPTCFQEIRQQTGFNVAGMFIDALEKQQ